MAIRFAVANGNWSNPAIWDNGAVPLTGDDVYANGFTVTLDTTATVNTLNNTGSGVRVPDIATPVMTSNSTPSGLASGTGGNANAWFAFNQNYAQGNSWNSGVNGSGILTYQFPSAKTIRRYGIWFWTNGSANQAPRDWTFQGSNDGTTWTTLDTRTGQSVTQASYNSYVIASPASFIYYRFNCTAPIGGAGNSVEITEFEMTESSGTVLGNNAGGTFSIANGVTFTCSASTGVISGSGAAPFTFSLSSPNSATLNCNIASINNTTNITTMTHSGTGTLTINGSLTNQGAASGIYLLNFTAAGTLNIVGDLTASGGNSTNLVNVIRTSGGGTINITGNVFQSAATNATGTFVIANTNTVGSANVNVTGNVSTTNVNTGNAIAISGNLVVNGNINAGGSSCIGTSAGNITINGNVTAGSTGGQGISTSTTGNITVSGTVTASNTNVAISSSSTGFVTVNGNLVNNSNGMMAVFAQRLNISASSTQTWNMFRAGGVARNLLTPDQIVVAGSFPATSDVRLGTTYGLGTYTGTLAMPSQFSVAYGVPFDGGIGAALVPTNIADLVWNKLTSNSYTVGSVGERMKNIATVDTTGYQIAALKR